MFEHLGTYISVNSSLKILTIPILLFLHCIDLDLILLNSFQHTGTGNLTETNEKNTSTWSLKTTSLRTNRAYVKYYSLAANTIVMVFIPAMTLLVTFIGLCKNIPGGKTKRKTLRILGIIMGMFLVCHLPKVRILHSDAVWPRLLFLKKKWLYLNN